LIDPLSVVVYNETKYGFDSIETEFRSQIKRNFVTLPDMGCYYMFLLMKLFRTSRKDRLAMASHSLFVYGTLRDATVQRNIIGRVVDLRPATLSGYTQRTVDLGGRTYPRLERQTVGRVDGFVMDLTAAELARVDGYEGNAYDRVTVTLADGSAAFVYVKPEDTPA
jgi:gamma-glutamylcyclotransferase (GGCT)/AIG2-like uncharacterized protein YtfP